MKKSIGFRDEETGEQVRLDLILDMSAAKKMSVNEARFAVNTYYRMQDVRESFGLQGGALEKSGEPHGVLDSLKDHFYAQERYVHSLLRAWAKEYPLGRWTMQVCGMGGGVLASVLLAFIDIPESVSKIWRFCGLDPTVRWVGTKEMREVIDRHFKDKPFNYEEACRVASELSGVPADRLILRARTDKDGNLRKKVTKDHVIKTAVMRPWQARMKMTCFLIGESFVRVSNNPRSYYGRLYKERKELETRRNEAGDFRDQAEHALRAKQYGKDTESFKAYTLGMLPKGQIHARARRYAVKRFLSHYWECGWRLAHPGETPPAPWIIEHGGHVDKDEPEIPYDQT